MFDLLSVTYFSFQQMALMHPNAFCQTCFTVTEEDPPAVDWRRLHLARIRCSSKHSCYFCSNRSKMSSPERLRIFVLERLTAAAEEIFGAFKRTIVEYEEEIDRQRRLLDDVWPPGINTLGKELPQQHIRKEEDYVSDQQLCDQETTSSLDQNDPKPPQIKEEEEELCSSQEGEQLQLKQEVDTFVCIPAYEGSDDSEPELKNQNHQTLFQSFHVAESQHDSESVYKHASPQSVTHHLLKSDSDYAHSPSLSEINCNTEKETQFKCDTCGRSFRFMSLLQRHVSIHTGERPHSCKTCGKDFRLKGSLKVHMRIHTGEKPYLCKTCGKRFSDVSLFRKHAKIHLGEKPYHCEICEKRFPHISAWKSHMREHTGDKPYICDTCGRAFQFFSLLQRHVSIHTGERPFSCETCGKDFRLDSALKSHMKIHTGEKPYHCKICGKRYSDVSFFRKHTRIHTSDKSYVCMTCGKGFFNTSALKAHMKIHTGEKPFVCDTCGRAFSFKENLKVHVRRAHTGEKPFLCKLCGKGHFRKCDLKSHLRTHTETVNPETGKPNENK